MNDLYISGISTLGLEWLSVVSWLAIGAVSAVITAMFAGGRRMLLYDITVGVVSAMAGGWGSVVMMGDNTRQMYIISCLTAVLFAGAALWVFNMMLMRRK